MLLSRSHDVDRATLIQRSALLMILDLDWVRPTASLLDCATLRFDEIKD
jgi:hypothetical protein